MAGVVRPLRPARGRPAAIAISQAYLRMALAQLLDAHVVRQRDYHLGKAGA